LDRLSEDNHEGTKTSIIIDNNFIIGPGECWSWHAAGRRPAAIRFNVIHSDNPDKLDNGGQPGRDLLLRSPHLTPGFHHREDTRQARSWSSLNLISQT
jgi:hypothetical protein